MTNGWDGVPSFQRNPWEGNISDWQKMGGTGDLVDPDGSLPWDIHHFDPDQTSGEVRDRPSLVNPFHQWPNCPNWCCLAITATCLFCVWGFNLHRCEKHRQQATWASQTNPLTTAPWLAGEFPSNSSIILNKLPQHLPISYDFSHGNFQLLGAFPSFVKRGLLQVERRDRERKSGQIRLTPEENEDDFAPPQGGRTNMAGKCPHWMSL